MPSDITGFLAWYVSATPLTSLVFWLVGLTPASDITGFLAVQFLLNL
jgi:hypothetical protein